MQMPLMPIADKLLIVNGASFMEKIVDKIRDAKETEAIDEYFECTSFCSIDETLSDCQTICMERFLKGHYF